MNEDRTPNADEPTEDTPAEDTPAEDTPAEDETPAVQALPTSEPPAAQAPSTVPPWTPHHLETVAMRYETVLKNIAAEYGTPGGAEQEAGRPAYRHTSTEQALVWETTRRVHVLEQVTANHETTLTQHFAEMHEMSVEIEKYFEEMHETEQLLWKEIGNLHDELEGSRRALWSAVWAALIVGALGLILAAALCLALVTRTASI